MIDFRSDTVTQPTLEMREAMYNAVVDDDVYEDDPTVNRLQSLAAEIIRKEAALFVPSGTMGNQIAIMTHTNLGDEIIIDKKSHISVYEAGAYARLSGVSASFVELEDIAITPKDIDRHIRPADDPHFPITKLVCVENPTTDGKVVPLEKLEHTYKHAKSKGLNVHMDGARIFNAASTLGVEAWEIAQYCDSIMFCLSKGLCAPIGSILCGDSEFIRKARRMRKILGGGMRQAGVIASCGIVALEKMIYNIPLDNKNAKYLGESLSKFKGINVNLDSIQTNMVFVNINIPDFDHDNFCKWMEKNGIKTNGNLDPIENTYRFVTHHYIDKNKIDYFIKKLDEFINI